MVRSASTSTSTSTSTGPSIIVLVETSTSYGRGVLRGLSSYVNAHGPWSIYLAERHHRDDAALPWFGRVPVDGAIVRIWGAANLRAVRRLRVPIVNLCRGEAESQYPVIEADNSGIARLAREHLTSRGFGTFAFFGQPGVTWCEERRDRFVEQVGAAGGTVEVYERPVPKREFNEWEREQALLTDWVKSLPKPVGVLACNDEAGRQVLDACRRARLLVPDDVAVLGVDDDEVVCELAPVSLSSIAPDAHRAGYEAAALLARLLGGEKPPAAPMVVPPLQVVARRSTDTFVTADPAVAAAVRFIRSHADQEIKVNDVLAVTRLSRRTLELRFTRALGRSPREEIVRARLERVKGLLRATDLSLFEIAERTGFEHSEHLGRLFKREVGQTPSQFRTSVRERLR